MTININGTTGISGVDGSAGTPAIQGSDTNTGVFFGTNTIDLSTDGTSRLSIGTDGDLNVDSGTLFVDASTNQVGIGTTSPGTNLHIVGTAGTGDFNNGHLLRLDGGTISATDTGIGIAFTRTGSQMAYIQARRENASDEAGYLAFATQTSAGAHPERMRIDSLGRVLVGTSTGTSAQVIITDGLQVTGAADDGNTSRATLDYSGNFARLMGHGSSGGGVAFFTNDSGSGLSERARITTNGTLRHGCINQPSSSVHGLALSPSILTVSPHLSSSGSTTTGVTHWHFINGNGVVGSIVTNGSATSFNESSDYRLKENIAAVTDGITRLKQLKPSRFNFIADPTKTVDGFIAHEIQDVVPEAVTGEKDAVDNEGNPEYQGIDKSKLVPLLTAALQEAITKIETLEARLSVLEGGAN